MADAQKHELIRTLRLAHGKSLRETARLAGVSKMTVIRVCSNVEDQEAWLPRHSPLKGMAIPSGVNISAFRSVIIYAGHFQSLNR
ncbi:transcriptional regulator with XRE-family HTH domain [Yokenella regensburgei]|nr:transcriptional regulator with XRE-family HTH domain [Yokenella regensburgei]